MNAPLPIGLEVKPHGTILDVWDWPMQTDGKVGRTYVLRNEHGIKYLPAAVVERGKEVTK